jgi:hypothetical protein
MTLCDNEQFPTVFIKSCSEYNSVNNDNKIHERKLFFYHENQCCFTLKYTITNVLKAVNIKVKLEWTIV